MAKFNPIHDIPSLAGKVCLVTGGNSGLGEATIAALAQHNPQKVYLAARSKSKAEAAMQRIKASSPAARSANIEFLEMDLSSFASIKAAAARVNRETPRLDTVHLNGGLAMVPHGTTKEGYELQFGTNFLGHALLTQLLLPKLLETAALPGSDVRVVSISSATHKVFAPKEGIVFDQLHSPMEKFGGPALYAQSMLAKIVFARELAKRYPQIVFASVHPGGVKSNAYSGDKNVNWFFMNLVLRPMVALHGVSTEEGAKTQLWCSFSKDVVSGTYYEPIGLTGKESALSKDSQLRSKLWSWTDKELLAAGEPGWPKA
ncbi:hypothetical protein BP6252_13855 [Coleophoma cylindrospora]|uniref:Uncharacterized protein n=1 Tax=Coleophoma cylindrospora TaxID=1849047 RepID=A0A3D8Q5L1_9HELO|nr:hypothetical protein BP6252_13855 [Coleophoma cylindrospora]